MQGARVFARKIRGFSLLEVILAIAILAGAIAVLGEVARLGMRNASRARDLAQAQLLCESKLAEILAGIEPAESVEGVSFETGLSPEWLYSIETAVVDPAGLLEVRVTVEQDLPPEKQPVRCALVRWMVDPAVIVSEDVAASAEEAAAESAGVSQATGAQSGTSQRGSPSQGSSGGQGPSGGGQPGGAAPQPPSGDPPREGAPGTGPAPPPQTGPGSPSPPGNLNPPEPRRDEQRRN